MDMSSNLSREYDKYIEQKFICDELYSDLLRARQHLMESEEDLVKILVIEAPQCLKIDMQRFRKMFLKKSR